MAMGVGSCRRGRTETLGIADGIGRVKRIKSLAAEAESTAAIIANTCQPKHDVQRKDNIPHRRCGIGRAVFDVLTQRDDARVIAGVRDVNAPLARQLAAVANAVVVEIDSSRDETPLTAAKTLQAQGIDTIDVVLTTAGEGGQEAPAVETTPDKLRSLLTVNSIAPLILFSAFAPLLKRSSKPRFLVASSLVGCFASADDIFAAIETTKHLFTPYAVSKAAVNMIVKRIALENDWLVAVPLNPGVVATDMLEGKWGAEAVQQWVQQGMAITAPDSARRIVKLIDEAQLQTHSGRFYDVQAGAFAGF